MKPGTEELWHKQKFPIKYKDENKVGKTDQVEICKSYFSDATWSKGLGSSVALVIVVVNLILKTVIILLVNWVGQET